MPRAQAIATALSCKTDLYAALRALAAALPDLTLDEVLRAAPEPEALRLMGVDQGLLRAVIRAGKGLPAAAGETALRAWLAKATPAPLFLPEIAKGPSLALLTRGEHPDMPAFSDRAFDGWFAAKGVPYGLGAYGEKRSVYATDQFADSASPERRTFHLGIDVFAPAMTAVHAPLPGQVAFVTHNADPLDYGHTLILEHEAEGLRFHTLYGHLAGTLPGLLRVGDSVSPGQLIAHLGDWHENGGWAAHLHFQIMTDMLDQTGGNFFGVGHESLWDVWQSVCPDPNLILRLPPERFRI
ncbi:peptidoglycan DD-metalloendopeptidase family protein [Tabrizicola oligotrophica]|uniref:Peptidoglycan DD-metalloendopeptidase family protein n=1 Tax=Tabrizicola oligotrophica TaxID=2710650 RepID=A0A6M0R049_9RHOB|nr:peptidoglycan DD-metalloendopeptidase family protein [Tabrizicola oligotrophica]NEY92272.1 peptidoglycan DD-metalloendopeptidase family protein [Tabrizicola oligotrophica]